MENIQNFLTAAATYGVQSSELFNTVDLWEGKALQQVVITVMSLARIHGGTPNIKRRNSNARVSSYYGSPNDVIIETPPAISPFRPDTKSGNASASSTIQGRKGLPISRKATLSERATSGSSLPGSFERVAGRPASMSSTNTKDGGDESKVVANYVSIGL